MQDEPIKVCQVCGAPVHKVVHAAGIIFKGSGWYITDSRKSSGKSESESAKGDDKADAKSESKSDTKPESKSEAKAEKPADAKATNKNGE